MLRADCLITQMCSPDGPGTPFVGWLAVWDTVRVLSVAISVAVIVRASTLAKQASHPKQSARFVALALFALVCLATELEHLGDDPSYRLWINTAAVLVSLYGCFGPSDRPSARRRGERA